jgi:hypothetical protein
MIVSSTRRRFVPALLTVAIALLAGSAALVAAPPPPVAAAYYCHDQTDTWRFSTARSEVTASAGIRWYGGYNGLNCTVGIWNGIYRGEPYGSVKLNRSGCMHVRLSYSYVGGSISFPPSGTISGSTVSAGYFRKCGGAGTTASLSGLSYAKRGMLKSTLTLWYSSSASAGKVSYAADSNYVP